MNYKEKLKSIETFEQLFDFRDELMAEEKKFSSVDKPGLDFDNIRKCQDINFWLEVVNTRIKHLSNKNGFYLDKIETKQSA